MKRIAFLIISLAITSQAWALPAFPGAEGMGASSVGGRGGTVYQVTNLNDTGAGSFRAAVTASGARIIVFKVSGDIRLATTLNIDNPYLTIAGQTSPKGICISGSMINIRTHDVIITHLRVRMSSDICDNTNICDTEGDALRIAGRGITESTAAYNIIVDHCSFAWGNDETIDIGGWADGYPYGWSYNTTISWCIVAQGVDESSYNSGGNEHDHGYGINIGSHFQNGAVTNVSVHHNYIAHFRNRMPMTVYNGFGDIRNNVIYNWYGRLGLFLDDVAPRDGVTYDDTKINAIGNYFKVGLLTTGLTCNTNVAGVNYMGSDWNDGLNPSDARGQVYASGNTGCAADRVWYGYASGSDPAIGFLDTVAPDFLASSAHATSDIAVTTTAMDATYAATVMAGAGATKCQTGDCRDTLDAAFVQDFTDGDGTVVDTHEYPNDYPTISQASDNPTDSDSDGMADADEVTLWGSIAVHDADDDIGGYNAIEVWAHWLAGYTVVTAHSTSTGCSGRGIRQ